MNFASLKYDAVGKEVAGWGICKARTSLQGTREGGCQDAGPSLVIKGARLSTNLARWLSVGFRMLELPLFLLISRSSL